MTKRPKTLERALEEAVSRALRDNLAPLQRTADELHAAYADLIAACSSTRPSNALPAMLRAQTAASSLAAGLSVLSNFVAIALNPREHSDWAAAANIAVAEAEIEVESEEEVAEEVPEAAVAHEDLSAAPVSEPPADLEWTEETSGAAVEAPVHSENNEQLDHHQEEVAISEPMASNDIATEVSAPVLEEGSAPAFDVASLSSDLQDLHRRANRVAKVAMQDIQLLRPKDVRLGRENKDICERLRSDIDKARKEYDRRFRAILDHPVDYFHRWMVEILAGGDEKSLGEYPYPSPVLRH